MLSDNMLVHLDSSVKQTIICQFHQQCSHCPLLPEWQLACINQGSWWRCPCCLIQADLTSSQRDAPFLHASHSGGCQLCCACVEHGQLLHVSVVALDLFKLMLGSMLAQAGQRC